MGKHINRIVIVGGGSAGWLTAGLIASKCKRKLHITLIESPDINPIGVGEGTWPSMRSSLKAMGISETDFFRQCDASFKQGSRFSRWTSLSLDDDYYHPFSLPVKYQELDLSPAWKNFKDRASFAHATSIQPHLCDRGLAPKQITTPEYDGIVNYGYHLDAGKFGQFLQKHCVEKLEITHIRDTVTDITASESGDIAALVTATNGTLEGDLFVDCTGLRSLLLAKHFNVPFISQQHILFNDRALAIQVPYSDSEQPILSYTLSTAQTAGWIWDIGLPSRRGVGHVFSSAHITENAAETELRNYIAQSVGSAVAESLPAKMIHINPGHRETFWYKNCIAIGMSAGFIEPLEATALVLVELAAAELGEHMPATRELMELAAQRFNKKFHHYWQHIIEFLKLHYVLSQRNDSPYWIDHLHPTSIPESLQQLMRWWEYQGPWIHDEIYRQEMFPSASYQYIINGMGCNTGAHQQSTRENLNSAEILFADNFMRAQQMCKVFPNNRALIQKICQFGLHSI